MWCFEIPVILLLVVHTSLCASQVTLELCEAPIKDEPCVLQCITPDLTQSVVFEKDNTEYASCKYILGTLSCTSIYPTRYLISQQSSPTVVTLLNITQLSRADDEGSWTCDYGSTGSTAHDLTVLTAPIHISTSGDVNIDYCTGDTRATYDVTSTVTCSSAVSVSAELSSPTGSTHIESLTVTRGTACVDGAESRYTAVFTIRSTTGGLTGDDYTLTFKTKLSAGVGEVYDNVFVSNITFSSENFFRVNVIMVVICAVISSGLVVGFTFLAVSRHDKGDEKTGCSCIVHSSILLALLFAIVITAVYFLVCWKINSHAVKLYDQEKSRSCCGLCAHMCDVCSDSPGYDRNEPDGKEQEDPENIRSYSQPTKSSKVKKSPKEKTCSTLCEVCLSKSDGCSVNSEVCSALCEVCMSKFDNHSFIPRKTIRELLPIDYRHNK